MDTKIFSLACAVATNVPAVLWGPPGIGKSKTVEALGEALGLPVRVVIASIHDPTDFSGIPVPDLERGRARYLAPEWAVDLVETGQGILFLDEISTAPPAVQAALLQVVLERRVGALRLPPGVRVIAAANPPQLAAGGWEMSPPLANRFSHIQWETRQGDLVKGLTLGWSLELPKIGDWTKKLPEAKAIIAAYLQGRPDREVVEPKAGELAFPTYRSWDMAAKMLAAALTVTEDVGLLASVLGTCVGHGDAVAVASVLDQGRLPTPLELVSGQQPLPERADRLFASLGALAAWVIDQAGGPDFERIWARAWELLGQAAEKVAPDVAAIAAAQLADFHIRSLLSGQRVPDPPAGALKPFQPLIAALKGSKK